jgi:enoyl-CoA hydratase/carnithine racemase
MADPISVSVRSSEGVALVTIDRPERRNALSRDAWLELRSAITAARSDPDTLGLIITGSGDRAFAAGADIEELADRPALVALDGLVQTVLLEVEALPFPTIAAVNGHALGGGWELALACDLRVAVSSARVGFPEVGLGIMPGAGGILRLLQHVGIGFAKEWVLTGRLLDASEAHAHGLVNRVVEPGQALDAARGLMAEIASQPLTAVRLATIVIDAAARGQASPELERLAYTLTFHSPERAERMHAFLDRRDPASTEGGG